MLNKFYVKLFLFCGVLFLCALIIDTKNASLNLPLLSQDEVKLDQKMKNEDEFLIYVSSRNKEIFPLNIMAAYDEGLESPYKNKINTTVDETIYMTFSLLTNYSNYLPLGVKTIIPPSTQLLDYSISNQILTLNVSNEFLNYYAEDEEALLSIITFTFTELNSVKKVKILCEGQIAQFEETTKDVFSRNDFTLNVYFNTTNLKESQSYVIYYLLDISDQSFLVPVTVYDKESETEAKESIEKLLTQTLNIPYYSLINEDNLNIIIKSEDPTEKLRYYQYYLTCLENNINIDKEVNIKNINYYQIELK